MNNTILKSAAEKMIQTMNQPLESLQKDAYWNNELVVVTSCLVEQKFPDEYREKNEEDLKNLQEEEDQEVELFKGFKEEKVKLKETLEDFLKKISK
ncbi:hypothetical protein PIB30_030336 [Stylosanthes scabra]|uniref:Uncharacterized protein n=1 Tax=Stylosanthes scabra TaxID=79078 RepID=A0ABU6UAX6_9FABA|nr:hypothetical protein [Stylosanthes scabra]